MSGWRACLAARMAEPTPEPRPVVNISIDVPDLEAGLRFYGAVFGFVETARPFASMAVLDANNVTLCLHAKAEGSASSTQGGPRHYARHWTPVHLDLHVAALAPVVARIEAEGGTVERMFLTGGPRPAAFCSDPFGNGFCVIAQSP